MEFRVLGELGVTVGGRRVGLGPAQRRVVLAALLCRPGRRVPVERLIEAVWGAAPPRTAAKNLQVHVYHLRRLLGDGDRVRHRSGGYLLLAGDDEVDGARFERLSAAGAQALRTGDLPRAERTLAAALALWRGPAFCDVAHCDTVSGEALRLDELRLTVCETLNEVRLRTGRHRDVIAGLIGLQREHPYRERLAGQLMTALYRDGRRYEALGVYQRLRTLLADEVGVDPGARLDRLYVTMLRGEPVRDGRDGMDAIPA